MTDETTQHIRDYCRAWSQRAAGQHRAERLRGKEPRIHQASPLRDICPDLTRADHAHLSAVVAGMAICMVRNGGAFSGYGRDYRLLWSWCAELLLGGGASPRASTRPTLDRLFAMTFHAALASVVPTQTHGVGRHVREVVSEPAVLVTALGFPLLEQLVRAACPRHFGADGYIVQAFETPGQRANRHLYTAGGTCSSVADLLWLYRERYASAEMGANLDAIDAHLAEVIPGAATGFGLLPRWRNETMSGTDDLPVIGATVLNLSTLIALASREQGFEESVARAVRALSAGEQGARFYPLEDEGSVPM